MKALVTYYSESGNTEKLAQAIYDGIELSEKDILPIGEVKDIGGYDLIFCGFPVQASSLPGKAESFIRNIPQGKKLALFATHGSLRGGQLAITAFYYAMSLAPKATILGTFGCRGEVKPGIIEALMKKPEHKGWAIEARSAAGHPDKADLADGKEFAGLMARKAAR
jgi:flavodoxin I